MEAFLYTLIHQCIDMWISDNTFNFIAQTCHIAHNIIQKNKKWQHRKYQYKIQQTLFAKTLTQIYNNRIVLYNKPHCVIYMQDKSNTVVQINYIVYTLCNGNFPLDNKIPCSQNTNSLSLNCKTYICDHKCREIDNLIATYNQIMITYNTRFNMIYTYVTGIRNEIGIPILCRVILLRDCFCFVETLCSTKNPLQSLTISYNVKRIVNNGVCIHNTFDNFAGCEKCRRIYNNCVLQGVRAEKSCQYCINYYI